MQIIKEFTLNTRDIQKTIIALIDSHCTKGAYLNENPELYDKICTMFTEMNKLCWEGNDYTITITAKS